MPYTDSIASLANATIAGLHRAEAATPRVAGRVVPPVDTPFTFVASFQPADGKTLKRLPEGKQQGDVIIVYTTTALIVGGQGTGMYPDRFTVDGSTYEVEHVAHWKAFGREHYEALARRVD